MPQPDLLLLHGALGSRTQFAPLIPLLEDAFQIHSLDFEGHGGSPVRSRAFRDDHFVENVICYLDEKALDRVDVFGYSMGGHIGLHLAKTRKDRVNRVFTLATKFSWSPEIATKETAGLDPEKILKKVPHFAKTLEERHTASGWRTVLQKTKEMFFELGERTLSPEDELGRIEQLVRIGVGDRDTMVGIEESVAIYRLLPRGELQVFPGTPHPLEKVPLSKLANALKDFFG